MYWRSWTLPNHTILWTDYEAMEAMGAGAGLMSWARILLTDTRSLAVVNGHKSRLVPMRRGYGKAAR